MAAPPVYIAIEGVIGVGKTTLARLLQPHYGAKLVLEQFEENPFLAPFYEDPARYAFQVQIFFLMSRYEQQSAVQQWAGRVPLVSDYLFAKDRLFARLNLQGAEWETYCKVHDGLAERIVAPTLTIFLRASVDTLMQRIARRGRPYERTMPRSYIAQLAEAYERFANRHDPHSLLVVDTDRLNVVEQPQDLAMLIEQIDGALGRIRQHEQQVA